jgi:MFS family permease
MGSGLGIFGVGSAAALAVGPSIGIALRDFGTNVRGEAFGYTVVFIFACLIMVVSLIPSLLITPQKRTKEEIASTGVWYKNIIAPNACPCYSDHADQCVDVPVQRLHGSLCASKNIPASVFFSPSTPMHRVAPAFYRKARGPVRVVPDDYAGRLDLCVSFVITPFPSH